MIISCYPVKFGVAASRAPAKCNCGYGMMVDMMPFSEFVEINPKVALKKGDEYPFVEMDIVTLGRRYISSDIKRAYKGGGAKFQAGDTLFAQITPCLENGKTAYVQFLPSAYFSALSKCLSFK